MSVQVCEVNAAGVPLTGLNLTVYNAVPCVGYDVTIPTSAAVAHFKVGNFIFLDIHCNILQGTLHFYTFRLTHIFLIRRID